MGCFSCGGKGNSGDNNDDGGGVGAIQSLGWNPARASELVTSTDGTVAFWDVANLGGPWVPASSNLGPGPGISVLETARFRPPDEPPGLVQWAPFGHGVVSVGKMKSSSSMQQSSEAAPRAPRDDTISLWSFPLTGNKGLRSPEARRRK